MDAADQTGFAEDSSIDQDGEEDEDCPVNLQVNAQQKLMD
jgi:hypothetical protein